MFYRLKKKILTIFGDIKVFKYPMFLIYQPSTFKIKGKHTREAMNVLQPGDIILRGYREYLDGMFIPGAYSHTGIFIGGNIVCHAVAEGVSKIDVIDFLRCDRFCILRPKSGQKEAIARVVSWLGKPYDFSFEEEDDRFYCHELGAHAYKELNIQKVVPYFHGIQFYFMDSKYLADSFLDSPDFTIILEVNE